MAVSARGAFTIISLLVSITLYGNVTKDLPKVGYFCFLDFYCLSVTMGALLAIITFVVVHWNHRRHAAQREDSMGKGISMSKDISDVDYAARAEAIDSAGRWAFPLYIVLVQVFVLIPLANSAVGEFQAGDIA